jgi:PAS domain S-box-containing protein
MLHPARGSPMTLTKYQLRRMASFADTRSVSLRDTLNYVASTVFSALRQLRHGLVLLVAATGVVLAGGVSFRWSLFAGVALAGLVWGLRGGLVAGVGAGVGLLLDAWGARPGDVILLLAVGPGLGIARDVSLSLASRARSQARYEQALADCSRALLAERTDSPLESALGSLLEATEATEVYLDINYHDPERGLSARTLHEVAREGAEALVGREAWTGFSYADNPTVFEFLSRGKPVQVVTSRLKGRERALYEEAGVRSELALPIFVGDEWHGVVGFADHEREREWSAGEVRLLTTVAEMISAFWAGLRAEEELVASEKRFRQLVEASPEPIAVYSDGRIVYANEAAARLVGASTPGAILGRQMADFIHIDSLEPVLERIRRLVEEHRPMEAIEDRLIRLDGAVVDVEMAALPISYEGGAAAQLVIRDITTQKMAQQQLEDLVKEKDEFLASISHELRTPLTVILGLASQLSDQPVPLPDEEQHELLRMIADQASELAHIIEDLLVETRADLGTLSILSNPVDLFAEVTYVCAGFHGVELLHEDEVIAQADPHRVRQVVRNLLTNAHRYGGSNITVTVIGGPVAKVQVQDNGPGIPDEHSAPIFEPYYRAHELITQPTSVGLGLTVSRKLARLMGGDLTYRRHDNKTVFELTLPLWAPAPSVAASDSGLENPTGQQRVAAPPAAARQDRRHGPIRTRQATVM